MNLGKSITSTCLEKLYISLKEFFRKYLQYPHIFLIFVKGNYAQKKDLLQTKFKFFSFSRRGMSSMYVFKTDDSVIGNVDPRKIYKFKRVLVQWARGNLSDDGHGRNTYVSLKFVNGSTRKISRLSAYERDMHAISQQCGKLVPFLENIRNRKAIEIKLKFQI